MRKLFVLISIMSFTAACGGGGGGQRRGTGGGNSPGPTPVPFGNSLHSSSGYVESSAAGMAMKASIGNTHHVTSAAGVAAVVSVGQPSISQ